MSWLVKKENVSEHIHLIVSKSCLTKLVIISEFSAGVVPPSSTWQSGNQFPRQASGLYPSQQPHGKYQAMLAPTQGIRSSELGSHVANTIQS